MRKLSFIEALGQIVTEDPRYRADAYLFLREVLDFTISHFNKPSEGPGRHVTGRELLEGFRVMALREFGPMALRVLHTWGVHTSDDVGELVFNLVNKGVLGKTDEDRKEDFHGGYDFDEAFRRPFLPPSAQRPAGGSRQETPAPNRAGDT